jgi:hypothetical protein
VVAAPAPTPVAVAPVAAAAPPAPDTIVPRQWPDLKLLPGGTVLPLAQCTSAVGGAKTASCAELINIAAVAGGAAAFKAPNGVCLPYGAMEAALEAADQSCQFEALLGMLEDSPADDGTLDVVCQEMMALVRSLRPPQEVAAQVAARLGDGRLIVRSSANVEDLEVCFQWQEQNSCYPQRTLEI